MNLSGLNFCGGNLVGAGASKFRAVNPATGEQLAPEFVEATAAEVSEAAGRAAAAFQTYRLKSGAEKADFLDAIADGILALGDDLLARCAEETGLPAARLTGERGRTMNQLRLFAGLLREGSWVDARIDRAAPERQPVPKPDVRSMQRPLGPVAVFGASNFPLAFSVAGGDTASALAAGCSVVVKAHPAHPGTCEMIAVAIQNAAAKCGIPDGVFSMVHGPSVEVGLTLVTHPLIAAVGFTGSLRGGKAIFDAAAARAEPIPVYAEMGSVNPVFILPEAMRRNGAAIAAGLAGSLTLGVGQFCTNPGLVVLRDAPESIAFEEALGASIAGTDAGVMLTAGIREAYQSGVRAMLARDGVAMLAAGRSESDAERAPAYVLKTSAANFLADRQLEEEVFGPSTLAVAAAADDELLRVARSLKGHLTASVFGAGDDFETYRELFAVLEQKVGRLIVNEFPTGVEVGHAMVHGGPFPATTDRRSTSVGTRAITRFTAPVCYQNFPDALLPDELRDGNPLGIRRMADGSYER